MPIPEERKPNSVSFDLKAIPIVVIWRVVKTELVIILLWAIGVKDVHMGSWCCFEKKKEKKENWNIY